MANNPANAGAVAFSRQGDPDLGDFEDAVRHYKQTELRQRVGLVERLLKRMLARARRHGFNSERRVTCLASENKL
jgi:hypothetical protein